jgi:transcriptional regulator with XRE-family HTH domain
MVPKPEVSAPHRLISDRMLHEMRRLIFERKAKNLREIAGRIGMQANSVYRIEKEPKFTFTLEQFYKFCTAFNLDPRDLFPK